MAHEHRTDVLIISEQYKNSNGRNWFSDRTYTAAIWVRNSESLHVSKSGEGGGFVWVLSKLNHAKFVKRFNNPPFSSILASPIERSREEVESLVNQLMQHITTCCDSAMPKRKSRANRTPTIDALRKDALKLRRIAQHPRGCADVQTCNAREQYRLAKKKLRREIQSSKMHCWLSLCKQIDEDEWGLGFKIVMQRFGKQTPVAPDDPR
nr:unnamed protein product [Callosobruchus analis]